MKNHDWDSYDRAAEKGPVTFWLKCLVGFVICAVPTVFVARACGAADEVAAVAQHEFGAKESLRKYEWLKDAAQHLQEKKATIEVYGKRLDSMKEEYAGRPRSEWARDDREQWSIWASELTGIKASFNQLAAQYNAQMSKFNWKYASGETPLPREFTTYTEE